jgi:hypothetical protein
MMFRPPVCGSYVGAQMRHNLGTTIWKPVLHHLQVVYSCSESDVAGLSDTHCSSMPKNATSRALIWPGHTVRVHA